MPFETTDVASKVGNGSQFDLGKTLGEYANIQNAFNQNKLFQAKNLAGQYLAQATGPDGTPDLGQFAQSIQQDKRTGPFAAEILEAAQALHGAGLQNVGRGIENEQSQTDLNSTYFKNAQELAAIGGTSSTDPDPEKAKAQNLKNSHDMIIRGIQSGRISPEVGQNVLGNLGDFTNAAIVSGAGGPLTQKIGVGENISENLGGVTKILNQKPQLGQSGSVAPVSGGTLTNTLPPSVAAGLNPTINPATHQSELTPTSSIVTPTGQAKGPAPISALAPGEAVAEATPKLGAAEQIKELQTQNATAVQDVTRAKQALAAAHAFRSGPLAGKIANLQTAVSEIFPGIKLDQSASSEQVHRMLAQQLAVTAGKSGMKLNDTDVQTLISKSASPDDSISNEAIDELGALTIGGLERNRALNAAWDKAQKVYKEKGTPLTSTDFLHLQTQFNQLHDPRYFQEPFMTPLQKQQMYKSMTPSEKSRYDAGKVQHNKLLAGYEQ